MTSYVCHPADTGWNGVVFVRTGSYAPGIFRFSIQFTISGNELVMPTVFFPPILLHALVEVRRTLTHAAGQRAAQPPSLLGACTKRRKTS